MSWRHVAAAAAAAALVAVPAAGASAEPPYLPWVSLLPPLATPVAPTNTNPCRHGSLECVDRTIREMLRMYAEAAKRCDHDAVFELTYLYVTQEYARTVA